MQNQARVRQYIRVPVMERVRCTNSIPVLSIWQRARAAVSSAVTQARAAVARVVAVVAKKASGVRASIARVARTALVRRPWILTRDGAGYAASRAVSWCGDAWRRAGRPFMRVRVVVLGIGAAVVGLVVAPMATLAVIAGCGVVLVGLSRLIAAFEASDRPAARVMLLVIEYAAQVGRALAYVTTVVVVVALSLVSVAFAVTEVLELVLRYLDVANAASMAALAFFVLTASWGLAVVEVAWLALVHTDKRHGRTRAQGRQVIPLIRINAERAWNGDSETKAEVADAPASADALATFVAVDSARRSGVLAQPRARTGKCMGCDLDDGGARFGLGQLSSLCDQCFSFLVEDELVNAAEDGQVSAGDVVTAIDAGIQVPAAVIIASGARLRSTRIDLDIEDVTCRMTARADSEKDPTRIYWVETAWWFDGRCNRRARQWHGFVAGRVVARVGYEHDRGIRGFYVAEPRRAATPPPGMGPYRTLSYAQEVAADEISDLRAANVPKPGVVLDGALRSVS